MINAFSKVMLKATDLKLSKYLFTDLDAGRKLALRFVAGETLEEAVTVAARDQEEMAILERQVTRKSQMKRKKR